MSRLQELQGLLRARDTEYGTVALSIACRAVEERQWIEGWGPRAIWLRAWRSSLPLACYRLRVPPLWVQLTESPGGRMIGEHLGIRHHGRWRFRHAQGVLPLPVEFSEYLRGRHRQAVRTNVAHARSAGLTVHSCTVESWEPGPDDSRAAQITRGPVERWTVVDVGGAVVANAILSVDEHVALLHGLVAHVTYARWQLHAAIVERLCGECDVLLVNSENAYLLAPGARHFQRLLGYRIRHLRLAGSPRRQRTAVARRRAPGSRRVPTSATVYPGPRGVVSPQLPFEVRAADHREGADLLRTQHTAP